MPVTAPSPSATVSTSVDSAKARNQPFPVAVKPVVSCLTNDGSILTASSILNSEAFKTGLENHPDKEFGSYIVNTCHTGVNIGYEGERTSIISNKWPSAFQHADAVHRDIDKDLQLGRKLGPFSVPPFQNCVVSLLGAVQKHSSSKIRVIHDLSWPPGRSINDHISPEEFSMSYMSIDDVVKKIQNYGPGTVLGKIDLSDAFHHILVRPDDWELLGSSWKVNSETMYYISTVLPFGLRSSPKLFSDFAYATKLVMLNYGVSDVDQYLDDFITLGPPSSVVCQQNMDLMLTVCQDVGFAVNLKKVAGPNSVLEVLGIVINTALFLRQET
jgi:hypothetical protein